MNNNNNSVNWAHFLVNRYDRNIGRGEERVGQRMCGCAAVWFRWAFVFHSFPASFRFAQLKLCKWQNQKVQQWLWIGHAWFLHVHIYRIAWIHLTFLSIVPLSEAAVFCARTNFMPSQILHRIRNNIHKNKTLSQHLWHQPKNMHAVFCATHCLTHT